MSRRKSLILTFYTVTCMVLIGYCGLIIWRFLIDATTERRERVVRPTRELFPRRDSEVTEDAREETPAPRELSISGRVFSPGLTRLESGTVRVGDEAASIAPDGTFWFPAAIRPRLLPFSFEGGGGEVEFPRLLTGDVRRGGGDGAPEGTGDTLVSGPSYSLYGVPERPDKLDWTLVLASPEPAADARYWISPHDVLIEEWGRGARLHVRGETNLPDGAHVHTNVSFDGYRVASTLEGAEVENHGFLAEIPVPDSNHLFAGIYELTASFNLRLENSDVFSRWPAETIDWLMNQGTEIVGERKIFVGDPEEARREDLAVQEYYRDVLSEARRLHQALVSRLGEIRLQGKGWDPLLLEASRKAHGEAWFTESFVDEEGEFAHERWRHFLDDVWRPRVKELLETHRERRIAKYVEAESRMDGLLDSLLKISRLYSTLYVYAQFNLPAHPNDNYDEDIQNDVRLLGQRLKEHFKRLERFTRLVEE